jgi:hypothetical protein
MDNDHRVQQLEQEVQLLKAQIQSTLLDIQEQLLSNRYPSLRMEEQSNKRPDEDNDKAHGWKAPRPAPQTLPEVEAESTAAPVPVIRLETAPQQPVNNSAAQAQSNVQPPLELPNRPLLTNEDWVALSKIARWMTSKSAELGPQRMRALIKMYAQKQQLAPEVMENLLQFMALYGDEGVQVMHSLTAGSARSPLFGADTLDLDAALSMDTPSKVRRGGFNTHA